MAARSPPSALEPYLQLPPETSLILLTGTLGCSANWLASRLISSALSSNTNATPSEDARSVLLISWLRDASFWKTEIRRTTGLDTTKPPHNTHFTILDLFTTLPPSSQLTTIITNAITALKTSHPQNPKLILLLDNPDITLATGALTSQTLSTLLLHLRSQVHATILSCSADLPLLSAATPNLESRPTPIEVETAAFLTSQAHAARTVVSVRDLETGAAKDVSGVLRVTRGGGWEGLDDNEDRRGDVKEAELLYLLQRDGHVKVFSRGSDQ